MVDRQTALRVLDLLAQTRLANAPVLVDSSGLFGFETAVQALTEDIDLAVDERLIASHEGELLEQLAALGITHTPGTATFVDPRDGMTFDLLGLGEVSRGDHIGGGPRLPVMVFEDLARALEDPRASYRFANGRSLTPAGFVAIKLLTCPWAAAHHGEMETPMGTSAVSLGPAPASAVASGASSGAPPAPAPALRGPSLPFPSDPARPQRGERQAAGSAGHRRARR